jgi:hypothetical protein
MLYLGEDEFVSFVEAFSQEVNPGPFGPIVSESRLRQCCLCPIQIVSPLRLVDLTNGPALNQLSPGADNRINDGPHAISQQWAFAFWNHPDRPDGLYYRSRRAPERHSIAVFERAADSFQTDCAANLLRHPDRLAAVMDYYRFALIP